MLSRFAPHLLAIALLSFAASSRPAQVAAGHRIHVVAVHDSSLFTLCPGLITGDYRQPGVIDEQRLPNPGGLDLYLPPHYFYAQSSMLDFPRPDWQQLAVRTPGVCLTGWADAEIKAQVEKELQKHAEYVLVDSADRADLVFLIEGISATYSSAKVGTQYQNYVAYGTSGFGGKRILQAAMAIALPAAVYRRSPADAEALLKARLWEGTSVWHFIQNTNQVEPASPEGLARDFCANKYTSVPLAPLCSAWTSLGAAKKVEVMRGPTLNGPAGEPPVAGAEDKSGGNDSRAIRIDVTLVTVPAIASDERGRHVPGLNTGDFRLFEDNIEQTIDRVIPEEEPFNVALMLDTSGSTTVKHSEIQAAALEFGRALRRDDRVMIVSFDSFVIPRCELTNDPKQLSLAISQTEVGGSTRLYDAVELVTSERLNRTQGRKAIVLFTDGVDYNSRLANATSSLARVEESNILVYVIQYDTEKDFKERVLAGKGDDFLRASQYLVNLSEGSGGRLYHASTVASLRQAFTQIAEELAHQYTLCYYPAAVGSEGSVHRIRVAANNPRVRIRARTSYRPVASTPSKK